MSCFFVLQEEGDFLCLPGGSDTQGQHRDEGRGQRTERDHHRKVRSFILCAAVTESKIIAKWFIQRKSQIPFMSGDVFLL